MRAEELGSRGDNERCALRSLGCARIIKDARLTMEIVYYIFDTQKKMSAIASLFLFVFLNIID